MPGSKLELVFVHPDPVLGAHLAKQKMSLMGRGVIEFIHPSERERESCAEVKRLELKRCRSKKGSDIGYLGG